MEIIRLQPTTVDGLRILWTHFRFGAGTAPTVLRKDLEAGVRTVSKHRGVQLTILTRERFDDRPNAEAIGKPTLRHDC